MAKEATANAPSQRRAGGNKTGPGEWIWDTRSPTIAAILDRNKRSKEELKATAELILALPQMGPDTIEGRIAPVVLTRYNTERMFRFTDLRRANEALGMEVETFGTDAVLVAMEHLEGLGLLCIDYATVHDGSKNPKVTLTDLGDIAGFELYKIRTGTREPPQLRKSE